MLLTLRTSSVLNIPFVQLVIPRPLSLSHSFNKLVQFHSFINISANFFSDLKIYFGTFKTAGIQERMHYWKMLFSPALKTFLSSNFLVVCIYSCRFFLFIQTAQSFRRSAIGESICYTFCLSSKDLHASSSDPHMILSNQSDFLQPISL